MKKEVLIFSDLEKASLVLAVEAPSPFWPKTRITLTLPILNRSRNVFFLVSSEPKALVINSILDDFQRAASFYPAAMVKAREKLVWYIDASLLLTRPSRNK